MIWLTDEERVLSSKREARERERQQDRIRERLLNRDDRAFVRELIERKRGMP